MRSVKINYSDEDNNIDQIIISSIEDNKIDEKVSDVLKSKHWKKRKIISKINMWRCFIYDNKTYDLILHPDCLTWEIKCNGKYLSSKEWKNKELIKMAEDIAKEIGFIKLVVIQKRDIWKDHAKELRKLLDHQNKTLLKVYKERMV